MRESRPSSSVRRVLTTRAEDSDCVGVVCGDDGGREEEMTKRWGGLGLRVDGRKGKRGE